LELFFKKFNMKNRILIVLICLIVSCAKKTPVIDSIEKIEFIPYPNNIESYESALKINSILSITNKSELEITNIIKKEWEDLTKSNIKIIETISNKGNLSIEIDEKFKLENNEAYLLDIDKKSISIKSSNSEGVYRGWQTLKQLIELRKNKEHPNFIPTGKILDYPEYNFRATMLDVSRHFFNVDQLKRFIDLVSDYKINYLHLGLTNDQGWRIEIKSRPKLTLIGGKTEVGGGKGGYYSQEDYKDIVEYARNKFITIIPEINIPGHTNAALSSYAKLNCDGKLKKAYTGTNVGFSTLCNNNYTFEFIDDVVKEVSAITPGEYFHIGGDESHVTKPRDYLEFVSKTSQIVNKYGKKVIGWDDIGIADITTNTVLQLWNITQKDKVVTNINDLKYQDKGLKNIRDGMRKGGKVLISPASKMYLDIKYDSLTKLGLNWPGYINLKTAYDWKIEEEFSQIPKKKIIGIEAPLWSETISTSQDIDYLTFPRLPAYSEIGWTSSSKRKWNNFISRIASHRFLWKERNINYYPSPLVHWK
tara:strand:- start:726 stop:2327 length:1602 start_codon:yes stop_codon:yes gene_type:complete